MILGQLRKRARQAKNAPLIMDDPYQHLFANIYIPIVGQHKNVFLMAGSRHCGGRKDHIGRVLGLLQRHLCLHRPGRLLRPHGQKRLETLDQ